jgi:hypothetical protein
MSDAFLLCIGYPSVLYLTDKREINPDGSISHNFIYTLTIDHFRGKNRPQRASKRSKTPRITQNHLEAPDKTTPSTCNPRTSAPTRRPTTTVNGVEQSRQVPKSLDAQAVYKLPAHGRRAAPVGGSEGRGGQRHDGGLRAARRGLAEPDRVHGAARGGGGLAANGRGVSKI